MALPKKYESLEDGLTIAAEIVSAFTGIPVIDAIAAVVIKKLIEEFSTPTLKLKDVLNKKTIKSLGIPDSKFDSVFEQTRIALRSVYSEDYNSSVFRKDVFTKNCFNPVTIADKAIVTLELGEEEKSDVLKAVRFALAVYLLRWTEELDFPLETRQQLQSLVIATSKNRADIDKLTNKQSNHETRITNLEKNRRNPIPAELTVIPKAITALIGRESVIQEITSRLETDHILCITADGGLGKTAIAKVIINNIRNDIENDNCKYKHVAWITSSGNLKEDLLQIKTPDISADNNEDKYINVCRFLQSSPTFLVVDNMDEPLTPDEINILNTVSGKSTILITTRASTDFSSYELPALDRDTAVVLFYNHFFRDPTIINITHKKLCKEKETNQIDDTYKIVDSTGRNSLMIELLAKTAHADHLSVTELWEKFGSGILGFESKTKVQADHSIKYSEFKLSIDEQMRRLYSMAILSDKQKEIMSFISLFPAEHEIFSDVFKWAGFFNQGADDMEELEDRGWLVRNDDFYSIHTIVRDSINLQNSKSGEGVSILNYKKLIKNLSNIDNYIPQTTEYNLAQKLSFVPQTVGKFLCDIYTSNISIGRFFNNLANLYNNQGNYNEALKYYNLALEIKEKILGKDHPSTATTYNNMARVYKAQGNYDEALKYYNMALEIREKNLGKDHPSTATTYDNIAGVYKVLGSYDEALKCYNIALEIREEKLGKDHPSTGSTYNNIAGVYREQGNYDESLKFLNQASKICEKVYGVNHPSTATTYDNIAGVYKDQDNYDEALYYYNMALDIREKILGKDHPSTATTYNNIAGVYTKQGNYDKAFKFLNQALEICEKIFGENHPSTTAVYNNMAGVYKKQGNYDEALKYFSMALEIREKILGKDHPSTATSYNNMAGVYKAQGNYDEALKYYNMAIEIREKNLGKDHPFTATTYNNIAGVYKALGNYDEALKFYNLALEVCEKILGKDHPSTATTYNNMAGVYKAQGSYDEALKYYNMALEIREKNLSKDNPSTATTYNNMAGVYKAQGNYDEALKYYNMVLEIREKNLGKDHPSTAATSNSIADLYKKLGYSD